MNFFVTTRRRYLRIQKFQFRIQHATVQIRIDASGLNWCNANCFTQSRPLHIYRRIATYIPIITPIILTKPRDTKCIIYLV